MGHQWAAWSDLGPRCGGGQAPSPVAESSSRGRSGDAGQSPPPVAEPLGEAIKPHILPGAPKTRYKIPTGDQNADFSKAISKNRLKDFKPREGYERGKRGDTGFPVSRFLCRELFPCWEHSLPQERRFRCVWQGGHSEPSKKDACAPFGEPCDP